MKKRTNIQLEGHVRHYLIIGETGAAMGGFGEQRRLNPLSATEPTHLVEKP